MYFGFSRAQFVVKSEAMYLGLGINPTGKAIASHFTLFQRCLCLLYFTNDIKEGDFLACDN